MQNLKELSLNIHSNDAKHGISTQLATIHNLQKFSSTFDLTNQPDFASSIASMPSLTSINIVAKHITSNNMSKVIQAVSTLRDISLDLSSNAEIAGVVGAIADSGRKDSLERVKIIGG